MNFVSVRSALQFIEQSELPPQKVDRSELFNLPAGLGVGHESSAQRAVVVGCDIISFVNAVSSERRQALVNSSLLAQLVAKKRVPDSSRIYEWYDAYFDALGNLGWAVQERGFAVHQQTSENFSAHQAILAVAETLLAGAPASLALVKSTLDALRSMDTTSPWITLFARESQNAKSAKFQVSLVNANEPGPFGVTMMAFGLEATSMITQVLFFKAKQSSATLRQYSGKITINTDVLDGIHDAIRKKLLGISEKYILGLPDLT
ncbi:MAG: hypothetical protein ABSG96_27025 [Terracidiphilus sp.]|jgi:hypothetical protein